MREIRSTRNSSSWGQRRPASPVPSSDAAGRGPGCKAEVFRPCRPPVARKASPEIGRAADRLRRRSVLREGHESGSGPSAYVISGVDVRPVVVIYPDSHKILCQERLNVRVRVAGFVHDVTPVAPNGGDGQEYGLVVFLGERESIRCPGFPSILWAWLGLGEKRKLDNEAAFRGSGQWVQKRASNSGSWSAVLTAGNQESR